MITHKIFKLSSLIAIALGLANSCKAAEQSSIEVAQIEHKKEAEEIYISGELSLYSDVRSFGNLKVTPGCKYRAIVLNTLYGPLNDNEPIFCVDYSSDECNDWTKKNHPKLGTIVFDNDWLPAVAPIKTFFVQDECITIQETTKIPKAVIQSIIAGYLTAPIRLVDCKNGDTIHIQLPLENKRVIATLRCSSYGSAFHIAARTKLLKAPQLLAPELLKKLQKEEDEYNKKQEELAELRRKKIEQEEALVVSQNGGSSCIVS